MNIKEMVQQVKGRSPELLGMVPNARAAKLIREAFAVVLNELENNDQGEVKIVGLGTFRIRLVENEVDGKKETVKRVVFVPALPKK